jgi:hypothetical protein
MGGALICTCWCNVTFFTLTNLGEDYTFLQSLHNVLETLCSVRKKDKRLLCVAKYATFFCMVPVLLVEFFLRTAQCEVLRIINEQNKTI